VLGLTISKIDCGLVTVMRFTHGQRRSHIDIEVLRSPMSGTLSENWILSKIFRSKRSPAKVDVFHQPFSLARLLLLSCLPWVFW
jgi:hypothetical protein